MRRKNYLGSQERQEFTYGKENEAANFSVLKITTGPPLQAGVGSLIFLKNDLHLSNIIIELN